MGFIDKLKGIVNPSSIEVDYSNDDQYENDLYDEEYQIPEDKNYSQSYQQQYQQSTHQVNNYQTQSSGATMSINANALELKVVRPEKFQNVTQIADHLLSNRTVVLNLEATNKETSRRIIDFLTGVAYSINGQLKKVANLTYVITPSNIDVSNDQTSSAEAQREEETGDIYTSGI